MTYLLCTCNPQKYQEINYPNWFIMILPLSRVEALQKENFIIQSFAYHAFKFLFFVSCKIKVIKGTYYYFDSDMRILYCIILRKKIFL